MERAAIAWRAPRLGAEAAAAVRLAWRATLASRAVVWAAGIAALLVWGTSGREDDFDPFGLTRPFAAFGDLVLGPAARWDSSWYLGIADSGYDDPARTAFFPLYPFLVRAGGWLVGSPLVAGVLISGACMVVALAAVHELTRLELGEGAARWTVLALALSPMSFFLSAVYSESLFLALSAGALLAARREAWWWAGALGGLAAATRSAGVVLLVPLALFAWRARRPRPVALAALLLVPAGLGAYLLGLAATGQDPTAPFQVQEVWFREWAGPFGGLRDATVAAWDGVRQLLSGRHDVVYFTAAGGD